MRCKSTKETWKPSLPTNTTLHFKENYTKNNKELGWMSNGVTRFLFLLNFLFILSFFDILQPFHKYLRLTLVSIWNSALRKKFNFCFSIVFASIDKIFILAGRLGTKLLFYFFRHFLIFSNFLSLKSVGKSWGNSYILCLWVIIPHRFTYGDRKIC